MKPPKTMPLPWIVQADANTANGFRVWNKDGNFFDQTPDYPDLRDAAAYIQHCVNVYPALIVALNTLANEAVAYVRDKDSDGRHLIAAADRASVLVQTSARHIHGEVLQ